MAWGKRSECIDNAPVNSSGIEHYLNADKNTQEIAAKTRSIKSCSLFFCNFFQFNSNKKIIKYIFEEELKFNVRNKVQFCPTQLIVSITGGMLIMVCFPFFTPLLYHEEMSKS